jgi:hypothetical protein
MRITHVPNANQHRDTIDSNLLEQQLSRLKQEQLEIAKLFAPIYDRLLELWNSTDQTYRPTINEADFSFSSLNGVGALNSGSPIRDYRKRRRKLDPFGIVCYKGTLFTVHEVAGDVNCGFYSLQHLKTVQQSVTDFRAILKNFVIESELQQALMVNIFDIENGWMSSELLVFISAMLKTNIRVISIDEGRLSSFHTDDVLANFGFPAFSSTVFLLQHSLGDISAPKKPINFLQ